MAAMASTLVLSSCSKLGELSADNFTVTPSPLEEIGGKVPVTINGRFPEKYMKKKAVVTVTPVLRYENGQATGQAATFQGEKVQGNNQEISYKVGGSYTMRNTFAYVSAMQKSELYLTFDAKIGKKTFNVPEVKVADGVIATATLLSNAIGSANTANATDAYQYAIAQTKQAQIKYLIQQAKVRTSELKTTSVQEFLQTLRDIKNDQKGYMLDGIEVSAYASPDGGLKLNTALAENRGKSSSAFLKGELKKMDFDADVQSAYTAEDWDGFQQLVAASNIQDKDVILRVLSMYSDPEEREQQIKNISVAFKELADEVLPELRRARLTVNYQIIGRSDDEIQEQYKTDAKQLSVEELLYSATLTENAAEQKAIYETTAQLYPNDYRAFNNLASLAYKAGDLAAADSYVQKALQIAPAAAEANANKALIAVAQGKAEEAQTYLGKAAAAKNYNEILGNLQVAAGNYAQSAQSLKGVNTNSAALSQLLSKNYTEAAQTLAQIATPDATTEYLKAVLAARTGQEATAIQNLKNAFAKDASLKERAKRDLEFLSLFNNDTFQSIVK